MEPVKTCDKRKKKKEVFNVKYIRDTAKNAYDWRRENMGQFKALDLE